MYKVSPSSFFWLFSTLSSPYLPPVLVGWWVSNSIILMAQVQQFLCGLHEVYSHIMLRPNLYIYLSTRVEGLSRGLVSAILVVNAL